MAEPSVLIDWATGRRFVRAVRVFLTSEVKGRARTLFALLFLCALAVNGLNVVNSYVGRDFMTAISQRDHQGFVRQAIHYIGVFAASTAVALMYRFGGSKPIVPRLDTIRPSSISLRGAHQWLNRIQQARRGFNRLISFVGTPSSECSS
jgi:ABC-type uncharacterized transport system fused permease/ATPase subunit